MKKKVKVLEFLIFMLFPIFVSAKPTASISASNTVEVGSSVTATVTLKNTASWNIEIKSSGQTSGCSQNFADVEQNGENTTKTLSVKCKATSTGTIGFTVTGDITDADGNSEEISLVKRVTVNPAREKSADANLVSLAVEGYDLSPSFNKEVLEYSTTIPSTVNSIKISAKTNESHASLSGTGEFEVSEGANVFEIVVTAETGTKKTYTVQVNVEDTNPIEIKIGDNNYTLIKNSKIITKPDFYEETIVDINGFSIPAFYSEVTKFTLVALKDNNGNITFAIYNEQNNTYILYNEMQSTNPLLYLIDFKENLSGYIKTTMIIQDLEIPVYKFKENSRFVLCYGMDITTGKEDFYKYDTQMNTFQIWDQEVENELRKDQRTSFYIYIIAGIYLLLSLVVIGCLFTKNRKNNKKNTEEKKVSNREKFDNFN